MSIQKNFLQKKSIKLERIMSRFQKGRIFLSGYEEKQIWTKERQGIFLESILLDFPLPPILAAVDARESWIIEDGRQRIMAITKFVVDKTLVLSGMEFLPELDGAGFDALPQFYQNRFLEAEMMFAFLEPSCPEQIRESIFKRLNS